MLMFLVLKNYLLFEEESLTQVHKMSHYNSKDLCIKWKIRTYLINIINLTLNPNCMHPCVYERMQDRAHAFASKRETAWKGAGKSWIRVKEKVYYQRLLKVQNSKHSMLPLETTKIHIKVLCEVKIKIPANASMKSGSLITHCLLSLGQGFEHGVWGEYEGRDYCSYSCLFPHASHITWKKKSHQIM